MKKILLCSLVLALSVVLFGCGSGRNITSIDIERSSSDKDSKEKSEKVFANTISGFILVLNDTEQLISDTKDDIFEDMKNITDYSDIALITTRVDGDIKDYANKTLLGMFPNSTSTLVVIDENTKTIGIYSIGEAKEVITEEVSENIVNNVKEYLYNGDYYTCIKKVIEGVKNEWKNR